MLKIESVKYNSYGQSAEADYLHGNLQDDITAVITYSLERVVYASPDNIIYFNPEPYIYGSVDNQNIIYSPDFPNFSEFMEGDEITIYNGSSNTFRIIDKIDDNTIKTSLISGTNYSSSQLDTLGHYIGVTTSPKALTYKYNIINSEDSPNYDNYLDGEENSYKAYDINTFTVGYASMMYVTGSKSHQNGTARIDFVDRINTFKLVFSIVHKFRLFPFLNDGDVSSLISGEVLTEWGGTRAYNHIFAIELLKEKGDENNKLVVESTDNLGDTGAYNEHFNTDTSQYWIESVEYKYGTQVLEAIDLNKITTVKIVYKSNDLFVGSFKPEVSFLILHDDFDNYLDTNQTYLENFGFGLVGYMGAINSSSAYRVFDGSFSVVIIDQSTIEVTVKVSLGSKILENINKSGIKRYALFITSEQNGLPVGNQTRSRDVVDVKEFSETLPQINIITSNTSFWLDPADIETGYISELPELFMTDDVYAVSRFAFKKDMPITISSIKNEIIAEGSKNVILESVTTNTNGFTLDSNGIQILNIDNPRALNQSYKSNLTIKRAADSVDSYIFDMAFPFIVGYREDLAIKNQNIPTEVYDITAVGNGLSNDWYRYIEAGMTLKYKVTFTFIYNSVSYTQTITKPINVNDYNNPEWTAKYIKLYNSDDTELSEAGESFIMGSVKIKAMFDKEPLPSIDKLQCYFFIAKQNDNGYRTSSTYDNTLKKIIFGSLEIVSGEVIARGVLNAEDFKDDVKIWCRLFESNDEDIPLCVLISEQGDYLKNESNTAYLVPEYCTDDTFKIKDSFNNYLKDSFNNNLTAL